MRYCLEIARNCGARLFGFAQNLENCQNIAEQIRIWLMNSPKFIFWLNKLSPKMSSIYLCVDTSAFLWKYMATGGPRAGPRPLGPLGPRARAHGPPVAMYFHKERRFSHKTHGFLLKTHRMSSKSAKNLQKSTKFTKKRLDIGKIHLKSPRYRDKKTNLGIFYW